MSNLSPRRGALSGLLPLLDDISAYRDLVLQLSSAGPHALDAKMLSLDLLHSARAYFLAALQRDLPNGMLIIAAKPDRARQLAEQIRQYSLLPDTVHYFPAPDALFYDKSAWALETAHDRVTIMAMLAQFDLLSDYEGSAAALSKPIVVTSLAALLPKTVPPMQLLQHLHELRVGQSLDLNTLLTSLLQSGYQPTSVVEEAGFFSRRGGIIDVFSPAQPHPLRIELFGDEIESLRFFDPASQRSLGSAQQITIYPASEALPAYGAAAAHWIKEADLSDLQPLLRQHWYQDAESLEYGEMFRGIEFYLPFLYERPASLLDYLPASNLLVFDDKEALAETAHAIAEQAEKTRAEMSEEGALPKSFPQPYFPWEQLSAELRARPALNLGYPDDEDVARYPLDCFAAVESLGGQLTEMIESCRAWQKQRRRVLILTSQVPRLKDLFQEEEIYPLLQDEIAEPPPAGALTLTQGNLPEGWALLSPKAERRALQPNVLLTLLTDNEIFGWAKHRRHREVRHRSISPEAFFSDYKEGDYVVHIEHGVALYRGLSRKTFDGVEREYLDLEYAAGDRLFVPVNQADRVTRYVGVGDMATTLQRLGTADWERVKQRAEKAVEDIAEDLLKLYAAREIVPGHAFAADTLWQAEMEASFPYVETEDQLHTIAEVKADMEKPRPMDRLICGDVGYGKTEVALRAAFKAVMDSKQVAILVPTTVLAQQHYLTFRDRLEAFPIRVEMLSRFRSRQEQQGIIKRLSDGQVDIVVGTHRLLQRDVAFKDLGLLIIDEEQRFGVAHKERLKQLRGQVDVLTLTATPIPRTLHMALTGARDMSTIDTPPEERLPVRTQVAESSDSLIRKAILREKGRGGQVYFVHNRVQGIRQVAQHLHQIIPEVSLVVGHGQMDEDELSRVMLDFMDGKYDVLVCTTIIESGLDIPNVNTIIINHADRFGLAQLYQLRGRVGRSSSQAYAYFLYSKGQSLSDIGRKRLEAIIEASELGAGFRLAMRDMEMRGVGEILGARQHGHIAAVGFDLYTRLLAQAVRELQDKPGATQEIEAGLPFTALSLIPTSKVDLPLAAHLPEEYVPDVPLRLKLYQRMANLRTLQEIDQVSQELSDRFGPLPEPVANLLYLLRIKVLADRIGAASVAVEGPRVFVRLSSPEVMIPLKPIVLAHFGQIAKLAPAFISLPWARGSILSQQTLLQLMETLAEAK